MGNTILLKITCYVVFAMLVVAVLPAEADTYTITNRVESSHTTGGNYSGSGQTGQDGQDGKDGQDGRDGADGQNVSNVTADGSSRVQITSELDGETVYEYATSSADTHHSATVTNDLKQSTTLAASSSSSSTTSVKPPTSVLEILNFISRILNTYVISLR